MVMVAHNVPSPLQTAGEHFVDIPTEDGFTLAARLALPAGRVRGTIVLHGATAVPQGYYTRFADYAAERGWRTLTYDYRGVGRSRPAALRGFTATMLDWAQQDARAVLAWLDQRFAGPRMSIGHSFGAQLLGVIDEAHRVDRAILIAGGIGYYGYWPAPRRWQLRLLWRAVPALTAVFGYLPGRTGIGEDLPAGVAREWATWCSSPNYLFDHVDGADDRMARFAAPTLVLSFTDDDYAPPGAIRALADRLEGAPVAHREISPEELGVSRIGHFGFFRPEHRDTLWRQAVDWLGDGDLARAPARAARPARALELAPALVPTTDIEWSITAEEIQRDLDYGR